MSGILGELIGNDTASLDKNNRLKKAKNNFGYFCRTYLSDYFYCDAAEYQQILYTVADTQSLSKETAENLKKFVNEKYQPLLKPAEKLAGAMFIEPREHGKTVRWSFAYVLWCTLTNRKRYSLLIGASDTAAKENLGNIKYELEENETILNDYGDVRGDVWKDSRIELKNGTCIQAKGAGASMRGTRYRQYRPDMIILDDVLKDDAAESSAQRNKIHRWLKRVVFNLGKNAFLIWVNTIFHGDDPISRLCGELADGTLKRWIAVRLSCLRPDGTPLWPEYWTQEDLNEKRSTIGFANFSTEYMNEPLSDEERIIHPEWIETHEYEMSELPPQKELLNVTGVDPATGKHDRTAMTTISVHKKTGIIYVRQCWGKTCSETATSNQLIMLQQIYHNVFIGWEEVAFSGIYGNYIQRLSAEKSVYLPIKKITTGGLSKETRIRALSPLIENGLIRFPKNGCKELKDELVEFPVGAFDDMCDSLDLAVKCIPKGESTTVIGRKSLINENSLAVKIIGRCKGRII